MIVSGGENLSRNPPHVGQLLIEAQNLSFEIDDQNSVGCRFEGGAKEGQGSARFGLSVASLRYVLDESDQVQRCSSRGPNDRHREVNPDDSAVLPNIALLH